MDEQTLRLECLKMALETTSTMATITVEQILALAAAFYEYVANGKVISNG